MDINIYQGIVSLAYHKILQHVPLKQVSWIDSHLENNTGQLFNQRHRLACLADDHLNTEKQKSPKLFYVNITFSKPTIKSEKALYHILGFFSSTHAVCCQVTLNIGAPQACPESPALLSTHATACPLTAPLLLSNLLMILWFEASFTTRMRPYTWMR